MSTEFATQASSSHRLNCKRKTRAGSESNRSAKITFPQVPSQLADSRLGPRIAANRTDSTTPRFGQREVRPLGDVFVAAIRFAAGPCFGFGAVMRAGFVGLPAAIETLRFERLRNFGV